jgi:hypothetical protein
MHGKVNGTDIFPGVRELARESGLSQRVVCRRLDLLVRNGWLVRQARENVRSAGACGFIYQLLIPQRPRPMPTRRRKRELKTAALTNGQHPADAPNGWC